MTRARITVSIPPELVESADRRAEEASRSRSWIVAEAVAAYVKAPDPEEANEEEGAAEVRAAPAPPPPASPPRPPGLDAARAAQLAADLELSPERRVLEAEISGRLAAFDDRRGRREFVIAFSRFEDYLQWKDREAAGLE